MVEEAVMASVVVVTTAAEAASGEAVMAAKLMRAADIAPNIVFDDKGVTTAAASFSIGVKIEVVDVAVVVAHLSVVDCGDGENAILVVLVVVVAAR